MRSPLRPQENYEGLRRGAFASVSAVIIAILIAATDAEAAKHAEIFDPQDFVSLDANLGELTVRNITQLDSTRELIVLASLMEDARYLLQKCLHNGKVTSVSEDKDGEDVAVAINALCGDTLPNFRSCTLSSQLMSERKMSNGDIMSTEEKELVCQREDGRTFAIFEGTHQIVSPRPPLQKSGPTKVTDEHILHISGTNASEDEGTFTYKSKNVTRPNGKVKSVSGPDSFGKKRKAPNFIHVIQDTWAEALLYFTRTLKYQNERRNAPTKPHQRKRKKFYNKRQRETVG